jgi:hypothetical protein
MDGSGSFGWLPATLMLLCQGGGEVVDEETVEAAGEGSFEAPPDLAL